MKEFDEFKKELGKFLAVFTKLLGALWTRFDAFLSKVIPNQSVRNILVIGAVCFFIGSFVGSRMDSGEGKRVSSTGKKSTSKLFSLKGLFGPKFDVVGEQKDGSFVLVNFEQPSDLKLWTLQNSKLVPSTNHETEGTQAGMITMLGDVESSAIHIEDYFESRGAVSNWHDYGFLAFDLYNPQASKQRLILQIKDTKDGKFKMNLIVPAKSERAFKIPMAKIDGPVDLANISQFTIFKWKPKVEMNFFMDNLRLLTGNETGERVDQDLTDPKVKFPKAPPAVNRPIKLFDYGFEQRKPQWLVYDPELQVKVTRAPFIVKDESGVARNLAPAQGGVPFAPGELTSIDHLRVTDVKRSSIPFQARVLGRWPDKSIRWVQIDLQVTHGAGGGTGYFLEYHPQIRREHEGSPLKLSKTDTLHIVETGKIKFTINRKSFHLFEEVFLDKNADGEYSKDERVAHEVPLTLKFRGETYSSHLDEKGYTLEVEEKGPEKIAFKASGWFVSDKGEKFCQWIVRIHAFKNKSYVRLYHTFIYTGFPENRYYERYKGLKLPENETVQDLGINFPLDIPSDDVTVTFGVEGGQPLSLNKPESVNFLQSSFDENVISANGEPAGTNLQLGGWVDLSTEDKGITFAVRYLREQFPKGFKYDHKTKEAQLKIWPEEFGELDLRTTADAFGPEARARGSAFGLGKTHEIFLNFHAGREHASDSIREAVGFQKALLVRVNPYWIRDTGAVGDLYPVSEKYASQEKVLERLFDWAARHPKDYKWYGMLDFGDTQSWFRKEDGDRWYETAGWHPIGRWGWYNCENAGTHSGALIQYIRSGEYKYFEFGENLARHIMDVDTVHYNTIANDPRLKVLDDEVSQVGSIHRHNGNHWGGRNEETTHTNIYGILLYYYLTGYERALDVAKETGDFVLRNPVTYTRHPDIAPHRALANVLWNDVLLYLATGEQKYKDGADQIMEIYLAGQNSDGSYFEQYDPLSGQWSGKKHKLYMAYYAVRAFIAYHEITGDPAVLKALEGVVRYVRNDKYLAPSVLNGLAYLYKATRNPEFIQLAEQDFQFFNKSQRVSNDSMYDGLIFKKPTYHRPNVFLYSVPFIYGAFEEAFQAQYGGARS